MQTLIETLRDCWGYVQRRRDAGVPRNIYHEHIMHQLEALGLTEQSQNGYYVTQAGLDFLAELETSQTAAEHRLLVTALKEVTEALADSIDSICQHHATSACNSSAMYILAMRRQALVYAAWTIQDGIGIKKKGN